MFVASAVLFLGFLLPTHRPWNFPRAVPPQLCDAPIFTLDPIRSAELEKAQPSPALQAREVIDLSIAAQQGIVEDLRRLDGRRAAQPAGAA